MFSIDPEMGDITVSRELDLNSAKEYMLQVKAFNPGAHPSLNSIPVHIMVTMADNASPRLVTNSSLFNIDYICTSNLSTYELLYIFFSLTRFMEMKHF